MLPTRLRMLLSIAPSPLLSGRRGASLLPLQVHQEISKSMKKALKNRSAFDFSLPSQPFPSTHNDKKKQQQTRLSLYLRPSLPRRAVSSVSAAMGGPPSHHRFSDAEMEAAAAEHVPPLTGESRVAKPFLFISFSAFFFFFLLSSQNAFSL